MKIFVLILALVGGCVSLSAQPPEWVAKMKKLQRLPATEKDVESAFSDLKIISESKSRIEAKRLTKSVEYEIPEGVLSVFYSRGRCSEENTQGYDLEDGVIISFYFRLKPSIEISKTGLRIKNLAWTPASDTEHIYYHDLRRGLRYTVLKDKLQAISFSVPDKFVRPCSEN
jgi:hypothetical protein